MCTLAIYFRRYADHPLIVAANRDEFLSRPSLPPRRVENVPAVFCGLDEVHGGTWLGVNARGLVAALLNRRSDRPPDPRLRSRGLLCLEMLRAGVAQEAADRARAIDPAAYNPFNLLLADTESAWVVTNHAGGLTFTDLAPGLHLLTNLDLNDPTCPRIAASYQLFAALPADPSLAPGSPSFVRRLRAILSTHETPLDPRDPLPGQSLCLHAGEYGTRSSSLLFLDGVGRWSYHHADDAPCRADYRPQNVGF